MSRYPPDCEPGQLWCCQCCDSRRTSVRDVSAPPTSPRRRWGLPGLWWRYKTSLRSLSLSQLTAAPQRCSVAWRLRERERERERELPSCGPQQWVLCVVWLTSVRHNYLPSYPVIPGYLLICWTDFEGKKYFKTFTSMTNFCWKYVLPKMSMTINFFYNTNI